MKKTGLLALGITTLLSASVQLTELSRVEINKNHDLREWKQGTKYLNTFFEVTAIDKEHHILFATTGVNKIIQFDISSPESPVIISTFDMKELSNAGGINSVAWNPAGYMAVAMEAEVKTDSGMIGIFTYSSGAYHYSATVASGVGALPDMIAGLTVENSSDTVLFAVACEGEPSSDYTIDSEGSLTLISKSGDTWNGLNYDFNEFDSEKESLRAKGVRIFGNNGAATVSQDFEPEYIAVNESSTELYISLQENNALAVFDLSEMKWDRIMPLGVKDHSLPENSLDVSNKDKEINIANWPVYGFYMPDAIATAHINGTDYIFTANEGDSRDYKGYSEEFRVGDDEIILDSSVEAFKAEDLTDKKKLGRLKITTGVLDSSDLTVGEMYDTTFAADEMTIESIDTITTYTLRKLYSYGGRSFSIFSSDGTLVWDSKNEFETKVAELFPESFNVSNDNNSFDNRSDDKGPEPEAIALGKIDDKLYAFIGLERMGGIMVYDVSDPTAPSFETYINNRDFSLSFEIDDEDDATLEASVPDSLTQAGLGDLGPETIQFVPASMSPTGNAMIAVGNEVSGSIAFYDITIQSSSVENHPVNAGTLSVRNLSDSDVTLTVPEVSNVSISIFTVQGRKVVTYKEQALSAGTHSIAMDFSSLSTGVYLLNIQAGSQKIVHRFILR